MFKNLPIILIILIICLILITGCSQSIDGYVAASTFSQDGFARNTANLDALAGKDVQIWGFVDHGNLYAEDDARAVLGDWWGGPGPDDDTWRFNLKAAAEDAVGQSFAVQVRNDDGRDALLARFAADATTQTPTRVFVTGRLVTFAAPTNTGARTGLLLEVQSSRDVLLSGPGE